ncbi:MAG: hypothetical protein KF893_26235 [Caldilineaceae bacterium]|nr:hypothetical protein [Caldilineaceae bacterium]
MPAKPSPSQTAQIRLAAALARINHPVAGSALSALQRGKAMADKEKGRLEQLQRLQRQSQAASNSVAVGPGRATADQRRRALARLLAARMEREKEKSGSWTTLAEKLIEEIGAMESDSATAQQRAKEAVVGVDQTEETKALVRLGKEQRVEMAERFLHALERAASAHAVMERDRQEDEKERKQAEQTQQVLVEMQPFISQPQGGEDDQ